MSLKEKYLTVLTVLKTEKNLHDDTYLAQFLDNTAALIQTSEDLDKLGLNQFLQENLDSLRELGYTGAEFNVKFLLDLSRTVIQRGDVRITIGQ